MTRDGLSHSEISGSKPVCDSPEHIAAYHVLHRLSLPSHSSWTLRSLTTKTFTRLICITLYYIIVKEQLTCRDAYETNLCWNLIVYYWIFFVNPASSNCFRVWLPGHILRFLVSTNESEGRSHAKFPNENFGTKHGGAEEVCFAPSNFFNSVRFAAPFSHCFEA